MSERAESGPCALIDTPEARQPFQLYGRMKQAGVLPKNIAEIPTDRIRIDMQGGNLIFAMTWSYVWNRLENDADSKVKGKIGVTMLPHDQGGRSSRLGRQAWDH